MTKNTFPNVPLPIIFKMTKSSSLETYWFFEKRREETGVIVYKNKRKELNYIASRHFPFFTIFILFFNLNLLIFSKIFTFLILLFSNHHLFLIIIQKSKCTLYCCFLFFFSNQILITQSELNRWKSGSATFHITFRCSKILKI